MDAFTNDYAIYIPSLRGSLHTDKIEDYSGFPKNFSKKSSESIYPMESFSISNMARDILTTVLDTKKLYPNATFHSAGFSFGTFLVQRLIAMKPDIFQNSILDGAVDPAYKTTANINQQLNFANLTKLMEENCKKDKFCSEKSLTNDELTSFVNKLANGESNDCLKSFVDVLAPGTPSIYHHQILYSLSSTFIMLSNIEIPKSLLLEDPTLVTVQKKYLNASFETWKGNYGKTNSIYLEFRGMLWALLNQIAQCNKNQMEGFKKSFGEYMKLLNILGTVNKYFLSAESPIGNQYITQILAILSEFKVEFNNQDVFNAQKNGPVRSPMTSLNNEQELINETKNFSPAFECWSSKYPTIVNGNVLFLLGKLDPNVPIAVSESFYNNLNVNSSFSKLKFIHTNAGHTIISLGWSKCSLSLIRGFYLKNDSAMNDYNNCLALENSIPIDWEVSTYKKEVGVSFWEGIKISSSSKIFNNGLTIFFTFLFFLSIF
jgi:hypothetical protein